MHVFNDVAIPLAWPHQTARGDEAWMGILKHLGIVKNLNFKVGHAAILLVEYETGNISYYDFGRYITPRGYGRARSSCFDPRLTVRLKARWEDGCLANFEEILRTLTTMEKFTHGAGPLYCSIATNINYASASGYAQKVVEEGLIPYGAFANKHNSCSRYVAQVLTEGMAEQDPRIRPILYPECLKASPTSNVVNASTDEKVYVFEHGALVQEEMTRRQSLRFQLDLLKDNLYSGRAKKLHDDSSPGHVHPPTSKPKHIDDGATWLGGIGEGSWFEIKPYEQVHEIIRYGVDGHIDYRVLASSSDVFDVHQPYTFTYDVDYRKHVVSQRGTHIVFETLSQDVYKEI